MKTIPLRQKRLYNRTRVTADFRLKFRRTMRPDLLGLMKLLETSDLGREGITHSGSFRFADHVYRNQPSGQNWLGKLLDAVLLNLPSARTMRNRFVYAKRAMLDSASKAQGLGQKLRILTVPCGIPRDVVEAIATLIKTDRKFTDEIEYVGLDLDPSALAEAERLLGARSSLNVTLTQGDALDESNFPIERFDFVSSTGLGEFLSDEQLLQLYHNVYRTLRKEGVFYTSAIREDPVSAILMRPFELRARYRTQVELEHLLRKIPWRELRFEEDRSGLQTYVYAVKEG